MYSIIKEMREPFLCLHSSSDCSGPRCSSRPISAGTTGSCFCVQFLSYLCYTAHLFLLGAATGAVSYLINTFRSFCLSSRYDFLRSRAIGAVICVFQILALVFTWSGWLSVLPVAANIATTIGGYTCNARTIRSVGMFINSPLWIAYDIIVGSWAGILDEIATEASILLSIFRYGWKSLGGQSSSAEVSRAGAGMTAACSACPRRKQVSYGLQPEIR